MQGILKPIRLKRCFCLVSMIRRLDEVTVGKLNQRTLFFEG